MVGKIYDSQELDRIQKLLDIQDKTFKNDEQISQRKEVLISSSIFVVVTLVIIGVVYIIKKR